MITRHTTNLGDRITRRLSNRTIHKDGHIKNGYTLIMGLILGFLIGVAL